MNQKVKGIIELIFVGLLFLFFSYIIQKNLEPIKGFISNDLIGIIVYIFIEIISIVIAPITTLPLVVIASNLWGWVATGILNVVGWTIGALIAFIIARKYGIDIIKKFFSVGKIYEIQKRVPKERIFWTVVLLRVVVPVDILSYALGIFTQMSKKSYVFSTIIGITPFAFIFAYLGVFPIEYQVILFLTIGILIAIGWITKLTCKKCIAIVQKRLENKRN